MKAATIATSLAATAIAGTLGIGLALARPADPHDRAQDRADALVRRAARLAERTVAPPGPRGEAHFVTELPSAGFREEETLAPEELADAAGCERGDVLWRRARDLEVCATPCEHDGDCAEGERCRVVETRVSGPHALVLAVDAPTSEDEDDAVMLCDPFWQEPGPVVEDAP